MNSKRGLALFFTTGVSLRDWREAGHLARELMYYRRLSQHVGPIIFVTYGGDADRALADELPDVRVLSIPASSHPEDILREHRAALGEAAIFKSNQIKGAEVAIRAGQVLGKPVMVRCGYLLSRFRAGEGRVGLRARLGLWRREWRLFHAATGIFLPTPQDAAYAHRWYALPNHKIAIVPNFVDTEHFTPFPDVTPVPGLVGFVGRLALQKNLPALISAVQGLPKASLRIIGDDPARAELVELAQRLGVQVEWYGRRPQSELPRLLAECQIFALPSHYEGHPKALLEAMACGLPVLGTPVMGIRPLIAHNKTGWLCPNTSAEAIREGLRTLLQDQALRERLGQAARQYIQDTFSLESVLERELAFYQEMGFG